MSSSSDTSTPFTAGDSDSTVARGAGVDLGERLRRALRHDVIGAAGGDHAGPRVAQQRGGLRIPSLLRQTTAELARHARLKPVVVREVVRAKVGRAPKVRLGAR